MTKKAEINLDPDRCQTVVKGRQCKRFIEGYRKYCAQHRHIHIRLKNIRAAIKLLEGARDLLEGGKYAAAKKKTENAQSKIETALFYSKPMKKR